MSTATLDAPAAEETRLPGDVGIWVFVLGDLVIFSIYFAIFMIYRNMEPRTFLDGQRHLDLDLAAVNTLILLTSSRLVALVVQHARAGEPKKAIRLTGWAMASGVLFLGIKAYEWTTEILAGRSLSHSDFFMFWFALTGVHAIHVVMGLLFLGFCVKELRSQQRTRMVELCATYWHMVDLLWVVIFALFYVIR